MIEKEITIKNKSGLHARPAAVIVQKANEYRSDIMLEKGDDRVNAKSIMGVMMLAAAEGVTLKIIASGKDEQEAVAVISKLLESDIDNEVKT
jgi:phosphotransferase system HPr (HPr) family protein